MGKEATAHATSSAAPWAKPERPNLLGLDKPSFTGIPDCVMRLRVKDGVKIAFCRLIRYMEGGIRPTQQQLADSCGTTRDRMGDMIKALQLPLPCYKGCGRKHPWITERQVGKTLNNYYELFGCSTSYDLADLTRRVYRPRKPDGASEVVQPSLLEEAPSELPVDVQEVVWEKPTSPDEHLSDVDSESGTEVSNAVVESEPEVMWEKPTPSPMAVEAGASSSSAESIATDRSDGGPTSIQKLMARAKELGRVAHAQSADGIDETDVGKTHFTMREIPASPEREVMREKPTSTVQKQIPVDTKADTRPATCMEEKTDEEFLSEYARLVHRLGLAREANYTISMATKVADEVMWRALQYYADDRQAARAAVLTALSSHHVVGNDVRKPIGRLIVGAREKWLFTNPGAATSANGYETLTAGLREHIDFLADEALEANKPMTPHRLRTLGVGMAVWQAALDAAAARRNGASPPA